MGLTAEEPPYLPMGVPVSVLAAEVAVVQWVVQLVRCSLLRLGELQNPGRRTWEPGLVVAAVVVQVTLVWQGQAVQRV